MGIRANLAHDAGDYYTKDMPSSSIPENSLIMHDLACLLIPQEIFPQSLVITDTRLHRRFPCETLLLDNDTIFFATRPA